MRILRALTAQLAVLALLAGLPAVLATTIGNPLHGLPALRAGDLSDAVIIDLLTAIAWCAIYLAWAQFAIALLYEIVHALTHQAGRRPTGSQAPRRLPGIPAWHQNLAHRLVASALLLSSTSTPVLATALDTASYATPPPPAATATLTATTTSTGPNAYSVVAPQKAAATWTHRLPSAGGLTTFWDLARTFAGDGERAWEIWQLNQGRVQADGTLMSSPTALLRPGWTILMPADLTPATAPETDAVRPNNGALEAIRVQPGDNLSALLAARGVSDWRTLWPYEAGRAEPNGQHYTNPDHIEPGWTVLVPAKPAPPATPPHPTTKPAPTPPHATPHPPTAPPAPPAPSTPRPIPDTTTPSTTAPRPTTSAAPAPPTNGTGTSPVEQAPHLTRHAHHHNEAAARYADLAAGSTILTAACYLALRRYRRRQQRHRRAGHTVAAPPPELRALEKTLQTQGPAAVSRLELVDQALRTVSAHAADLGVPPPPVQAIAVTDDQLEMVFAGEPPSPAPPGWHISKAGHWTTSYQAATTTDAKTCPMPYPTLASIAHEADGSEWLLNLEYAGSLAATGEPRTVIAWLHWLVAELAHNPWSDDIEVTVAGFAQPAAGALGTDRTDGAGARREADDDTNQLTGPQPGAETEDRARIQRAEPASYAATQDELVALNPSRIAATDNLATILRHAADRVRSERHTTLQRQRADSEDGCNAHVLILGPAWQRSTAEAAALDDLLAALADHPQPAPLAVVFTTTNTTTASRARATATIDSAAKITLADPALTASAPQLPADEVRDLAALLAAARTTGGHAPVPPDDGSPGRYADLAGAIRPEHTIPRSEDDTAPEHRALTIATRASGHSATSLPAMPAPTGPARAVSLLPHPTAVYTAKTGASAADIVDLAPGVRIGIATEIAASDPTLHADLDAWHDPQSPRPKLRLLGPVTLTAHGREPEGRIAFYTEAVTYLATHPRGVTGDRFAADLWPDRNFTGRDSSPKNAVSIARKWLGTNPETGADYLPVASTANPAGVATYQLHDVLVDADLFRRLRTRGQARGPAGIADLRAALELVSGPPLSQRRLHGYGWLHDDGIADEHTLTIAVVDVAHLVATAALADGDTALAQRAIDIALTTDTADDRPLLDLAVLQDAQGRHGERDDTVRRIRAHHDAEVEEDLPPQVYQTLLERGWLTA